MFYRAWPSLRLALRAGSCIPGWGALDKLGVTGTEAEFGVSERRIQSDIVPENQAVHDICAHVARAVHGPPARSRCRNCCCGQGDVLVELSGAVVSEAKETSMCTLALHRTRESAQQRPMISLCW